VPAKDGGRVPAREILINNSAIANLIRENHIGQIKSTIQTGAKRRNGDHGKFFEEFSKRRLDYKRCFRIKNREDEKSLKDLE